MIDNPQNLSASSKDEIEEDLTAPNLNPQTTRQTPVDLTRAGSSIDDPELSPNQAAQSSLPILKRRRVTRACDECRRKKIKCDGKQPCTHCTVYSYECTYDQPSNRRRNPAPQYVEALEVKLQRAEAILKSVYPNLDLDDPAINDQFSLDELDEGKEDGQTAEHRQPGQCSSQNKTSKGAEGDKDPMLESMMQETGSLDLDDDGYWDFYGRSSGRAFLRMMRDQFGDLVGKVVLPPMQSQDQRNSPASSSASSPWVSRAPNTSDLPQKECARMLCENALDDACAILRFVHQPTFYHMFDRVYDLPAEELGPEETKFIPMLYSCIALGSLFATHQESELQAHGVENAMEQGKYWFRTARSMTDVSDCRDLASLQTLLFTILFLQSSSRLSTCYSQIGIALRSAIRMGLHRSVIASFNPVEQEVRKRVFWCVRKLDTYVGAMLGLPNMLSDEDIDQEYPIEVDDEYITTEGIFPSPPNKPTLMTAFNAHTRIVRILAKTVKYIYPVKGPKSKSNQSFVVSHARIREIEQDLQKWYEKLPEAFRPGGEAPPDFVRMQHLLRMAYAHMEMFLYRPFLHYVSQDLQSKNIDKRSYACAAACVSVARNIVHLASEMKKKHLLIGSYWFYMYTTFFAVMCLVFYVLENPHSATSAEILRDAHEGKDTLAGLAKRSLAADKCSRTLAELFERLPERLKGARMNSAPQKKRQAQPILPVSQPQMLASAPDVGARIKTEPNPPVRRSNTMPAPHAQSSQTSPFGHRPSQVQMPPPIDAAMAQRSRDTRGGTNLNSPYAGNVPASPFNMQNSVTGLEVPDLSAMMFPSSDPFAYPNQPMNTLEDRQEIKQEQSSDMYPMNPPPPPSSSDSPYEHMNRQMYGNMPPQYMMANQSAGYSAQDMNSSMHMTNANLPPNSMALSGSDWAQQSPNQMTPVTQGMSMDQLFGEDWGGWMNQGYRQ